MPAWGARPGCPSDQKGGSVRRLTGVSILFAALTALLVMWGGSAAATQAGSPPRADRSGSAEFGDEQLGPNITECPQAGIEDRSLRQTRPDEVEQLSER